ncbi:MAG: phosphotransferase family protein [Deltaproteobacteria bacterium]|nr:phosphotransferase family protein [Deltaproteobacteria bacterium]
MPSDTLEPEIIAWVAKQGAGDVTRAARHVARREAWLVDVSRPDGSRAEWFLSVDRAKPARPNPFSLARETRVLGALGANGIRVPRIHGWSEAHQVALQERVRGSADLPPAPPAERRAVLLDFVEEIARMHALTPAQLALDLAIPQTPAEAALGEVNTLEGMLAGHREPEPIARFGVAWLRKHVPEKLDRVALVQGDTGPGNFLYEGARMTALVDFEWAHFGDPMEDLGNFCVREFFAPCGGVAEALAHYGKLTGAPVPLGRVRYFRVQQMTRSVLGLVRVTSPHDPRGPVAMNLAYRVICERALCEAIADALGIALEPAALPDAPALDQHALPALVAKQLSDEIAPALPSAYLKHRAESAAALVECIERERRYGAAIAACEREELSELLGIRVERARAGRIELEERIRAGSAPEAATLRYLACHAQRAEALYAPVVAPFAGRKFSPLA